MRTMTIHSSVYQARFLARVSTDGAKNRSVLSRIGRGTRLRLDSLNRVLVRSLFWCMGRLNISRQLQIKVQEGPSSIKGRECSKKFVQQGRSHFHARSVLIVREHGKRARTPLAAFFNIPCTVLMACVFAVGCATVQESETPGDESENPIKSLSAPSSTRPSSLEPKPPVPPRPSAFTLEERMSFGNSLEKNDAEKEPEQRYSFRAQEMLLADALRLFARANSLNIVVGPEIKGLVTLDFQGLSLRKAMVALLDAHGFYWVKEGELMIVRRLETRIFTIDYIRLVRSGSGRSEAKSTSGSSSGSSGGSGGGTVQVGQVDVVKFWEELEQQLKAMISEEGRFVVNRLSGTIQVTDLHRRVEQIAEFLSHLRRTLYRQVEIEARIYEVALNDDYSLGIDWNRIDLGTVDAATGNLSLQNIISIPAGGFTAKAVTTTLSFVGGSFDAVLTALHEQGEVRVISQPRLLTMNNQPALIKVARDESFFTQVISRGVSGTNDIITEQVQTVSVGLILSVTPQISEDGWIMLDVTPIITRLSKIVISPQGTATAPVIDVKQISALVRVRDGEMVVIGGLIQDSVSHIERKVPILGDLPWVGRIFKGTYDVKEKTELVIFLSPRIVGVDS